MNFNNKVAIITGGASGIGRATAIAMAKASAKIVIVDINKNKADEVKGEIEKLGAEVIVCLNDVTNEEGTKQVVEQTLTAFGYIDYLCNSAGLQTYGTVETTSVETWDKTMNVNLKSMFLMAKVCIPEIKKRGGGAIVNITSVQGFRCQKNVLAYATSKGAVIAMTRAMALDYAKDSIQVNCVCPGSIDTPMLRYGAAAHGPVEEVLKEWGNHHPIGRIGQPEEIANAVKFLFSSHSSFMVGQPVVVDGGLTSIIL